MQTMRGAIVYCVQRLRTQKRTRANALQQLQPQAALLGFGKDNSADAQRNAGNERDAGRDLLHRNRCGVRDYYDFCQTGF
jgi:hypothetical protein